MSPIALPAPAGASPALCSRTAKYAANTNASQLIPSGAAPPPAERLNRISGPWNSSPVSRIRVRTSVMMLGTTISRETGPAAMAGRS